MTPSAGKFCWPVQAPPACQVARSQPVGKLIIVYHRYEDNMSKKKGNGRERGEKGYLGLVTKDIIAPRVSEPVLVGTRDSAIHSRT